MNKRFYNSDVCVVGLGCVLPDAGNPSEFWSNILAGKCSIRKISEERWSSNLYFSLDKNEPDKTYSNVAAFVENKKIKSLCGDLDIDFSKNNRLQVMALGATTQALSGLSPDTLKRNRKNTAIFLGCMELDEAFTLEKFYLHEKDSLKKFITKNILKNQKQIFTKLKEYFCKHESDSEAGVASVLTTSVINLIRQKFNLQGESALIDAACASSLAAIDVAVRALRNYQTDLAITGGMESNLAPSTFIIFSKAGVLSQNRCLPFDKKTDGLSQGEGAVIFALQRMEDAIKDNNKIYGVIKSIGSSSDGRSSSSFSPSKDGQVLAFRRAYQDFGENNVNYVECHGTGTKIGDGMELASLSEFFGGQQVPIGSVKSLVGHTKGAAGATGLLKCILILQNKLIPSAKYLETPITDKDKSIYPNKDAIDLKDVSSPLRLGISSFGFGNTNYHLVLDEFNNSGEIIKAKKAATSPIVLLGSSSISLKKVDLDLITSKFKIPPQSLPYIDKVQLQALLAVDEAFEGANIDAGLLDKEEIKVISASCLGLSSAMELVYRIEYEEFRESLSFLDKKSLNLLIGCKNKFLEATEDTGPGVLNNVIAGRVCNIFDFKGKNFNVDADFNSFSAALNIASRELQEKEGIIVLLDCEEELNKKNLIIERTRINCSILTTLAFAREKNYPIGEVVKNIYCHS